MHGLARPIPESYWVVPNKLLVGEYPGHSEEALARRRLGAFLEAGFSNFIDLTIPGELLPYLPLLEQEAARYGTQIHYQRFPIADYGLPTPKVMEVILNALDTALESGRKTYLHCWGGVGRSGTTVGCYLVRQGLTGEQALAQLATWWQEVPKHLIHPTSPETSQQMEFVLNWREKGKGKERKGEGEMGGGGKAEGKKGKGDRE
jgi:hypothetical protein